MTISELIELVTNKLAALQRSRAAAWYAGDTHGVAQADTQLIETQTTLDQLRTLVG